MGPVNDVYRINSFIGAKLMWGGMWFVDCDKVDSLPSVSFRINVSNDVPRIYNLKLFKLRFYLAKQQLMSLLYFYKAVL